MWLVRRDVTSFFCFQCLTDLALSFKCLFVYKGVQQQNVLVLLEAGHRLFWKDMSSSEMSPW